MSTLTPYPFAALVRRAFREIDHAQAVFDLPVTRFFQGDPDRDFSVRFHGRAVASPFGPAAGPHTQLAQNIVLSWLAGGRIIELKTVQILDELAIPRPCIDVQTVGFNAEWSQELKLEQALEEYVKAAMLIEILTASGRLPMTPGSERVVYDLSVGYDLAGLTSERVQAFIGGMQDATALIDRLRRDIPLEFAQYRDLPFPARIADSVTLSTFHGCPPGEIEKMIEFLLHEHRLHSIVKLNPMLLGPVETRRLLHDVLGYRHIAVPDSAFERDLTWDGLTGLAGRLGETAASVGLGFGVKFTNTLVVENDGRFIPPSVEQTYLSGPPLHVLAMQLVGRFRETFGDAYPISFSGGVDSVNFPDAVAIGLVPVTVCTDLLRTGGYARASRYTRALAARMDAAGATTIDDFVIRAYGRGSEALAGLTLDPDRSAACARALATGESLRAVAGGEIAQRWAARAAVLNTATYLERLMADPRYTFANNRRTPRKIGRDLQLFDCLSCDKCIPVCPNDANFTFVLPPVEIPIVTLRQDGAAWRHQRTGTLAIREQHQIGNFADFCNDCGNCDVFCPEDKGPYVMKPRFFGTREGWTRHSSLDGFHLERDDGREVVLGRFGGQAFRLDVRGPRVRYAGDRFSIAFDEADPLGTVDGNAAGDVDLTYFYIMNWLRRAVLSPSAVNYVNSLACAPEGGMR